MRVQLRAAPSRTPLVVARLRVLGPGVPGREAQVASRWNEKGQGLSSGRSSRSTSTVQRNFYAGTSSR